MKKKDNLDGDCEGTGQGHQVKQSPKKLMG